MMRVTGKVEFLEDKALEERLFKDRPWVADLMKAVPKDAKLAIFRVAHGEAWFWTMENNMREDQAPRERSEKKVLVIVSCTTAGEMPQASRR
jgi:uncharacterized pyridoxamine 5'-phosphate oxidase family protein